MKSLTPTLTAALSATVQQPPRALRKTSSVLLALADGIGHCDDDAACCARANPRLPLRIKGRDWRFGKHRRAPPRSAQRC